ncbi:MAG: class I SAM-dependent methyltransferase, partial [Chlamydiota bacterium]|nr:class I SAM-dependent methyltransferase [Chlamydiota bacterium]
DTEKIGYQGYVEGPQRFYLGGADSSHLFYQTDLIKHLRRLDEENAAAGLHTNLLAEYLFHEAMEHSGLGHQSLRLLQYYLFPENYPNHEHLLTRTLREFIEIQNARPEHIRFQDALGRVFQETWQSNFSSTPVEQINQNQLDIFWSTVFAKLDQLGHQVPEKERILYRRIFRISHVKEYMFADMINVSDVLADLSMKTATLMRAYSERDEDAREIKGLSLRDITQIVTESDLERYQSGYREEELNMALPKTGMVIMTNVGGASLRTNRQLPYGTDRSVQRQEGFFIWQKMRRLSDSLRIQRGNMNWFNEFLVMFKKGSNETRRAVFLTDWAKKYVDHVQLKNAIKNAKKTLKSVDFYISDGSEYPQEQNFVSLIDYAGYRFVVNSKDNRIYLPQTDVEEQIKGKLGQTHITLDVIELDTDTEGYIIKKLQDADLSQIWAEHLAYTAQSDMIADDAFWPETVMHSGNYQKAKLAADETIIAQLDRFTDRMSVEEVSQLRILDLASGDGTLMGKVIDFLKIKFPGVQKLHIEGVERNQTMAVIAQGKGLQVKQGDAKDLSDFGDNTFDVVIAEGLLSEHVLSVEDSEAILAEIQRVVKSVPLINQDVKPREKTALSDEPPASESYDDEDIYRERLVTAIAFIRRYMTSHFLEGPNRNHLWSDDMILETFLTLNIQAEEKVLEIGPMFAVSGILAAMMGAHVTVIEHPSTVEVAEIEGVTYQSMLAFFQSSIIRAGGSIEVIEADITRDTFINRYAGRHEGEFDHIIATDVLSPNPRRDMEQELAPVREMSRLAVFAGLNPRDVYQKFVPSIGIWEKESVEKVILWLIRLKNLNGGTFYLSHPESAGRSTREVDGLREAISQNHMDLLSIDLVGKPQSETKSGFVYRVKKTEDKGTDVNQNVDHKEKPVSGAVALCPALNAFAQTLAPKDIANQLSRY